MEVTCFLKKEGSQYASLCVELDVASCGRTKKDALDGLKRAIETYIEYMVSEGREKEMYRPVPMNELKTFLFPEDEMEEIKASKEFIERFHPKHKETMARFMELNKIIANSRQA